MLPSDRLTENFTFGEFTTTSRTALRETNRQQALQYLDSLRATAEMLQIVRDRWGRIKVNSGFRGPALNSAIGGSKTSQHMKGEAVDFEPIDAPMVEVFDWVADESGLSFGQLILEGGTDSSAAWIHMSLGEPWRSAHKSGQVLRWTAAGGYRNLR